MNFSFSLGLQIMLNRLVEGNINDPSVYRVVGYNIVFSEL